MTEVPTVYLTKEQLQRLAGLSCDALVGMQLHTNASDDTNVLFDMVTVDDPNESVHGVVMPDGSWMDTS
jgi:hypothetical protein